MPHLPLLLLFLLLLPPLSSFAAYTFALRRCLPPTAEHLRALALRDRRLAEGHALAFRGGDRTLLIGALGFLHYVEVEVGTPRASFLVALDTGSDLFWLPCDCGSCAPPPPSRLGFNFSNYNPSSSSTSRNIFCNSTFCEGQSSCSEGSDFCPYKVAYTSPETTSSGLLLEDILYLTTEDTHQESVQARVIFGCGQTQTGSFLSSAAPNGLLGLGMDKISVPSVLADQGLISNSYSVCFGHDGSGKITLGDKGSSDQEETPFKLDFSHPAYVVNVSGINVDNISHSEDFSALVDSGSSFTTLSDPAYTHLTNSFHSQVLDKRYNSDPSQIPFEYCYITSSNQSYIPTVRLTLEGGSEFPVYPVAPFSLQGEVIYCLAVLKGGDANIIGQNYLTGLKVVFDRERAILGWQKFNCHGSGNDSSFPGRYNSSMDPQTNVNDPEAAKHSTRINQTSMAGSLFHSQRILCWCGSVLLLLLCFTLIFW